MSDTVNYGLLEVDWNDPRAIAMRDAMDAEIQPRYAGRAVDPEGSARALAVNPNDIVLTVLAIDPDGRPVGHAALRRLGPDLEVKRVVVLADARGHGLARRLMAYLENFAEARGARRLILQTGDRQPDAVALYRSLGYQPIAIYQPYTDAIPFSMCFEKLLAPS
jgi:GNAT superfamily N-acetyltransferase